MQRALVLHRKRKSTSVAAERSSVEKVLAENNNQNNGVRFRVEHEPSAAVHSSLATLEQVVPPRHLRA